MFSSVDKVMEFTDRKELRHRGRNASFCNSLSNDQVDIILGLLFSSTTFEELSEMLATISNILLINRGIHSTYFTPIYSKKVLRYIDIQWIKESDSPDELQQLIPIYRIIFLILCDSIPDVEEQTLSKIQSILTQGFDICMAQIEKLKDDATFDLLLEEILKGAYALYHRYEAIIPNKLPFEVLALFNYLMGLPEGLIHHRKLKQSSLNVLLVSFKYLGDFSSLDDKDVLLKPYRDFVDNLAHWVDRLLDLSTKCATFELEDVLFDLSNSLSLVNSLLTLSNPIAKKEISTRLAEALSPTYDSYDIFSKLICVVLKSSILFRNGEDVNFQPRYSLLKDVTLNCIYELPQESSEDSKTKIFLELVGYIIGRDYLQNNDISLPKDINIEEHMKPKYGNYDTELNNENGITKDLNNAIKYAGTQPEFSLEEKEREAEKLFVLFEKMERTGIFEGFQNPVREWQQLGKFDELE
ncbi:uncharacterized protein PRCAT00005852001 [Priceomyces carsonii]|uniref:uncharacterized protein n=1 Tax=Priceomyces carsonii TaxID=28549 RepID=UPI002EDA8956|nr:unnamed protein product [Priceomyces carsonii]